MIEICCSEGVGRCGIEEDSDAISLICVSVCVSVCLSVCLSECLRLMCVSACLSCCACVTHSICSFIGECIKCRGLHCQHYAHSHYHISHPSSPNTQHSIPTNSLTDAIGQVASRFCLRADYGRLSRLYRGSESEWTVDQVHVIVNSLFTYVRINMCVGTYVHVYEVSLVWMYDDRQNVLCLLENITFHTHRNIFCLTKYWCVLFFDITILPLGFR